MARSEAQLAKRRAGKAARRRRRKARSSTDSLHTMYERGEQIVFAQQALRKLGERSKPKKPRRRLRDRLRPGDRRS